MDKIINRMINNGWINKDTKRQKDENGWKGNQMMDRYIKGQNHKELQSWQMDRWINKQNGG